MIQFVKFFSAAATPSTCFHFQFTFNIFFCCRHHHSIPHIRHIWPCITNWIICSRYSNKIKHHFIVESCIRMRSSAVGMIAFYLHKRNTVWSKATKHECRGATLPTTSAFFMYIKQNFCYDDKEDCLLHFFYTIHQFVCYGCQTQYLTNNIMHAVAVHSCYAIILLVVRIIFALDYVINEQRFYFYF